MRGRKGPPSRGTSKGSPERAGRTGVGWASGAVFVVCPRLRLSAAGGRAWPGTQTRCLTTTVE